MTAQVPAKTKAKSRKAAAGRSSARPTSKSNTPTSKADTKAAAGSAGRPARRQAPHPAPKLRGADRRMSFEMELSAGWALVGELRPGRVRAHLEHTMPVARAA
jgi:hypothetical protein